MLILSVGTINLIYFKDSKLINENIKEENSNFISMMVEQEDGSYKENPNINFVSEGYMFNQEKSGCENGGSLVWNSEKEKIEASLLTSDKCYAYFEKYDFTKSCLNGYEDNLGCDLVKNKDNTLIYHDGKCDYEGEENCDLEAGDFNYRYNGNDYVIADKYKSIYPHIEDLFIYSREEGGPVYVELAYEPGENYGAWNDYLPFYKAIEDGYLVKREIKNYICFGSDEKTCPYQNLYRIIGIYNGNVKLVKADYLTKDEGKTDGSYYDETDVGPGSWDYHKIYRGQNTKVGTYYFSTINKANWSQSELNEINLNTNFLNSFSEKYQNIIKNNKWQIIGKLAKNAKEEFEYELGNKKSEETTLAKIGLMYVNDFMYSADSHFWNFALIDYVGVNCYVLSKNTNYLALGLSEWAITSSDNCTNILTGRGAGDCYPSDTSKYQVRPSFYLIKDVKLASGTGTSTDPYRIS